MEGALREAGAHMLIIETGSGDDFADTRAIYGGKGYDQEGAVPDFYEDGLDKNVFRKRL